MILQDVTALQAEVARLQAKLVLANKPRKLTMKVSKAGAVSIYGFGKWPVTLYSQQMLRLLDNGEEIRSFIEANAEHLSVKE